MKTFKEDKKKILRIFRHKCQNNRFINISIYYQSMEIETVKYSIALYPSDVEYLKAEGQRISTIIRKIVHDYVEYHKVKNLNPMKLLPEDTE